jgi:adenosylcobyric acid synthase
VLRLKYIANFTDFGPFLYEPDVECKYSLWEEDISSADLIIVPGSKNTVADLILLRESGIEDCVKAAVKKGTPLIGVCGGYQMIGQKIQDPDNVESSLREIDGMGFLDTVTTMDKTKTTCQVNAGVVSPKWFEAAPNGCGCRWNNLKGYEIHMGNTTGEVGLFEINRFKNREHEIQGADANGSPGPKVLDGSVKDNVWGTYIHGIFDNDGLRTDLLNSLRKGKGLPEQETLSYGLIREKAINGWAETLCKSVDICFILRQVEMEFCMNKIPGDAV